MRDIHRDMRTAHLLAAGAAESTADPVARIVAVAGLLVALINFLFTYSVWNRRRKARDLESLANNLEILRAGMESVKKGAGSRAGLWSEHYDDAYAAVRSATPRLADWGLRRRATRAADWFAVVRGVSPAGEVDPRATRLLAPRDRPMSQRGARSAARAIRRLRRQQRRAAE